MHGYTDRPATTGSSSCALVERADAATLKDIESVSEARRPLLAYGAIVLEEIIRARPAARDRGLGARRARRPALRAPRRRGARAEDPLHRRRGRPQPAALPLAPPRRGAVRLDRPLRRDRRPARDRRPSAGCATPPASSPISAGGRIPITAASRASTSSPTPPSSASTIPAAPISRCPCSSATRASRPTRRARACGRIAGPRLVERARLLGALMRVAYPVSVAMAGRAAADAARRPRRPRSCCSCRRSWRRWRASASSAACASSARLIGLEAGSSWH